MAYPPKRNLLSVALVFAALVTSLAFSGSATAASAPVMGAVTPASVGEASDWASVAFSDPWDFSQTTDINTQGQSTISGGLLSYTPTDSIQPNLLWTMPGSQPWGRDGAINPINADVFTRFSVEMWSSADSWGGLSWTRCSWAVTSCRGFMVFQTYAGWHTYDVAIAGSGLSSAPAPWSHTVIGLRLWGQTGPSVKVDWAHLYAPTSNPDVTVSWTDPSPGRSATVYWDSDADLSNNTSDQPGWGVVATIGRTSASNATPFHTDTFPAGTYRFYVVAGGVASQVSSPLTIAPLPRPAVLSPTNMSGGDYGVLVRHDPWDMAQRSDFSLSHANLLGMNGAWFAAQNTSNDPQAYLPMPSAFAGSTYHRLRVHVALIGGFSLANAPGGGCVGRLYWTTASGGPTNWQMTDDLVLFPGWNDVIVDLATSPSSAIVEPDMGANRIGWAGQTITRVRFDPNEDPGAREWYLDDVRLMGDARSNAGSYTIQYSDGALQPGTTATVQAISSTTGAVITIATGVPVAGGTNSVTWTPPRTVATGYYKIKVVLTNASGSTTRWASGPLYMIPA